MWYQLYCVLFFLLFYMYLKKTHLMLLFYGKIFIVIIYGIFIAIFTILPVLMFRENHFRNFSLFIERFKHWIHTYGIKWRIQNRDFLATANGGVIVMNHQSILDNFVFLFISQINSRLIGTSKIELTRLILIPWLLKRCGVIFIDRSNPKLAYESLHRTVELLKTEKAMLWLYPEGTRNKERKTKLLPFKRGAFVIAVTAQLPIYPVICSPQYFLDEKKYIFQNDGKIVLRCLPPVPTKGLTIDDVPELRDRIYRTMLDAYEDLAKEISQEIGTEKS